jgi:hypothetical protein
LRIPVPGRAADADPPQHRTCGKVNSRSLVAGFCRILADPGRADLHDAPLLRRADPLPQTMLGESFSILRIGPQKVKHRWRCSAGLSPSTPPPFTICGRVRRAANQHLIALRNRRPPETS